MFRRVRRTYPGCARILERLIEDYLGECYHQKKTDNSALVLITPSYIPIIWRHSCLTQSHQKKDKLRHVALEPSQIEARAKRRRLGGGGFRLAGGVRRLRGCLGRSELNGLIGGAGIHTFMIAVYRSAHLLHISPERLKLDIASGLVPSPDIAKGKSWRYYSPGLLAKLKIYYASKPVNRSEVQRLARIAAGLYTIEDVAAAVGVYAPSIYWAFKKGRIQKPGRKLPGSRLRYYSAADVEGIVKVFRERTGWVINTGGRRRGPRAAPAGFELIGFEA